MILSLVIALTFAVLYWFPIRRWTGHWGATSSDLDTRHGGRWPRRRSDVLLHDGHHSSTRGRNTSGPGWCRWAISVAGSTATTGSTVCSAFSIVRVPPAFSPSFSTSPSVTRFHLGGARRWPVAVIEPRRALVLDMRNMDGFDWVWQFGLYPVDENRTRLVSRSHVRPLTVWATLFSVCVIEPAGFFMTRRMLLGLKQRAEVARSSRTAWPLRGRMTCGIKPHVRR